MPASQITYLNRDSRNDVVLISASSIVLSSAQTSWRRIKLEQFRLPALELPESIAVEHLVTIKLSAPSVLEWKVGGRFQRKLFLPGDTCLTPAEAPREMRWLDRVELLVLALDPKSLLQVAQEIPYADRIELIQTHGEADAQMRYIGLALKAELESGNLGGRMYADALTNALAIHMLARYNAYNRVVPEYVGGLSSSQLHHAIEYIHDHLDQDISLFDMAEAMQMSVTRFKSLFKQSTGLAPHQYVLAQRVERAKHLLIRGDLSFSQIATLVGFYDQSHLIRHFKRRFGVTPGAFRRLQ